MVESFGVPQCTLLTGLALLGGVVVELGWLTKLSNPIVIDNEGQVLGVSARWGLPVEDFGFGFARVTLAILLWRRWLARHPEPMKEAVRPA